MKLVDKQNKFNSGVISTKLSSRDDLDQYQNGVASAVNFVCSKYGPIEKRVGTQFIEKSTASVSDVVRLVPFVLSVDESILLEFRDKCIYFYRFQGGQLGAIMNSGGNAAYYITTSILAAEIEKMSYTQSLDTMYLAFPSGLKQPMKLVRRADNDWSLTNYETTEGPFLDINYDSDITVTIKDATNLSGASSTVSWSTALLSKNRDIGRWVRINTPHYNAVTGAYEDRWSVGKITAVNKQLGHDEATVKWSYRVKQFIVPEGSTEEKYDEMTTPTTQWRLGVWGFDTGTLGDYQVTYPTKVTIHQQRLVWSGMTDRPWVWMSCPQSYTNFSPSDYVGTVTDSNAISVDISTEQITDVKWMRSAQALLVGTELNELRAKSAGIALTPSDCAFERDSSYGSYECDPVIVDDTFIFIQRLQRVLRGLTYDDNAAAYRGPELTVLADNLTIGGIKKIVFQKQSASILWALREDGHLLAMTYDKDQQVTGWTECILGGGDVAVLDMCVLPCAEYQQDMLIIDTKRKINGEYVRYRELLSRDFLDGLDRKEIPFLDCAMRHTSEDGFNIIYGDALKYFLGEELRVFDKGAYAGDYHVETVTTPEGTSSYGLNLAQTCTDVWIGIPYDAYFETLERDFQDKQLSTSMAKVRIYNLKAYLYRTLGLTVQKLIKGSKTVLATFSPLSRLDTVPEEITERVNIPIVSNWEPEYRLRFESEPGLPCTVTGIITGVEINAV